MESTSDLTFLHWREEKIMRCTMCRTIVETGHAEGCPEMGGNLQEFDEGHVFSFYGKRIRHHILVKYYSKSFVLGYYKGLSDMEQAVNEAITKQFYE